MKNIKFTVQQTKLLIYCLGLFIFVITYLYIYSNLVEKTEGVKGEINNIRNQIETTEKILAEEEALLPELDKIKEEKAKIINDYPVYIAKEDNLMFLDKLNKALNINMTSNSITDSSVFYTTILPAIENEAEGEEGTDKVEAKGKMTGVYYNISLNFQTTTEGFKELVDYINEYPDRTMIQNASISYDRSTGGLTGNINIKRFALTGSGKEYKPSDIGQIDIGADNIFGEDQTGTVTLETEIQN